jgi:hypothetical protein
MLKTYREGQLVNVEGADGGRADGVVAHVVSLVKLEVAVEDSDSGPVFRTAHPKHVTPRDAPGPSDDALHRLIHRAAGSGQHAPAGGSRGGRRAHTRAATHRTTDR